MDFGPKLVNRIKNFKLPTRNQSIFLGTAGTIGGLLFFDQNSVAAIQDDLKRQASIIANEPAAWNERPRKVKVFFDSSYWPTYWFNEFAKPVLDAGAIDYEIIEGIIQINCR